MGEAVAAATVTAATVATATVATATVATATVATATVTAATVTAATVAELGRVIGRYHLLNVHQKRHIGEAIVDVANDAS